MSIQRSRHRGVAALLAMLYLVLFSVMAVGFYAAVTSAMQVSHNDAGALRSRLAAESGMELIRYQLAGLKIPHGTKSDTLLDEVYDNLMTQMDGTGNLGAYTIALADGRISIPAGSDEWIEIDGDGMKFRATIEASGTDLRVRTKGRFDKSELNRNIKLDYSSSENESTIFDFGVASRSPISMDSNAKIRGETDPARGKVLSTNMTNGTPITLKSNSLISGDVSLVNPDGNVSAPSGAIGGDIYKGVPEPEFPTIDTSVFKPFAGATAGYGGSTITPPNSAGETKYDSGTMRNILIKASPHPDRWVVFDSNMTIDGVVYIETPNKVKFDSNVIIRGVIVVQNDPTHDYNRNRLEFDSNVKLRPIESLAGVNNAYFPPAMTSLTGSSILAPNFTVSVDSNFGVDGGTIVGSKIVFDSNASGTIKGSVINLEDSAVTLNGNADIAIANPDGSANPAGVFFTRSYYPVPETYEEVVE